MADPEKPPTNPQNGQPAPGSPTDKYQPGPTPFTGLVGRLKLDGDVPDKAAQLVADLAYVVDNVAARVPDVHDIRGFPSEVIPSAASLVSKYATFAEAMAHRLADHQRIITEMGVAFLRASKAYEGDEDLAASVFDRLRKDPRSGYDFNPAYTKPDFARLRPGDSFKPRQSGPDAADAVRGGSLGLPVNPENREWLDYWTAYQTGQSIPEGQRRNWEHGSDWRTIGKNLMKGYIEFRIAVSSLLDQKWEGEGAQAARKAITDYKGKGVDLGEVADRVGTTLQDSALWLNRFGLELPQVHPDSIIIRTPAQEKEFKQWIERARTGFASWYGPGVEAASNGIPKLPEAYSTVNAASMPTGGGTGPGGGAGGGSGGGAGGGGGAPGMGSPPPNLGGGGPGPGAGSPPPIPTPPPLPPLPDPNRPGGPNDPNRPGGPNDPNRPGGPNDPNRPGGPNDPNRPGGPNDPNRPGGPNDPNRPGGPNDPNRPGGAGDPAQKAMQAASAAQQALANKDQLNALQDKLKQQQAGLPKSLEDALKGRGAGGPGPGPGIGAGPLSREAMSAKLFPRASAVETGLVRSAVAGPVSGTPGAPGPAGAPAHGNNQGQNKDHKRADYLDSVEHLDEAIGTPPVVSRPVVDQ